ncbi:hypothetical protein [Streptomyces sp. NPDC002889]|uniref:hypothetical protein n=1 Tax=Streptomyces sp. NPDC002889 TaxID=3364669 RepID=UPI0036B0389A
MPDESNIRLYGDIVDAQVVVGDRNIVINAERGSSVSVRTEEPPPFRRKDRPEGRALPREAPELLGRDLELAALERRLAEGHAVQIYGPPGIGKTALLRRFMVDRAADGAAVVHLSGAGLPVTDLVQDLFHACYEVADYKPEPARMRRLMAAVRALLVVDDFHGSRQDLAELVDAAPGCEVVVASIEPCPSGEARAIRLGGLPEQPALALLTRELRRPLSGGELSAARRLVATAGGHPLTLVQVADATRVTGGRRGVTAAGAGGNGAGAEGAVAAESADRATGTPDVTGPGEGFDVDESALAVGLAARLSDGAGELLRLLAAFAPLPVSPAMLGALAGDVDRTAAGELESLALAASDGAGLRAAGRLATLVAERAGTLGGAARFAAPLLEWVRSTATRQQIAAEAAAVVRVMAAAARVGDHPAVRDLARATAPALARTLRWGSWQRVLEHGAEAARALGSAEDAAYFAHEEEVRKRGLGLVVGVPLGAVAGAGAVLAHGASAGTAAKSGGGLAAIVTNPVTMCLGAAAVVAGGLFAVAVVAGGGDEDRATGSAAPRPGVSRTVNQGASTSGGTAGGRADSVAPTRTRHGVTTSPTRPTTKGGSSDSGECEVVSLGSYTPGRPIEEGEKFSEHLHYTSSQCDDVSTMTVSDPAAWAVEPAGCPPPGKPDGCAFDVTFAPPRPGTYKARVNMYSGEGVLVMTLDVTGTGVPAAENTVAAPTDLQVTAVNSTTFRLRWADDSGDAAMYEMNTGNNNATVEASWKEYEWGSQAPGTTLCFRIRSLTSDGRASAWTPAEAPYEVCATTPNA